jgi:hypothetical protein
MASSLHIGSVRRRNMTQNITIDFQTIDIFSLDTVNGGLDLGKINAAGQNAGTTGALVGGGVGGVVGGVAGAVGGTALAPGPGSVAGAAAGAATFGGAGAALGGGAGYLGGAAVETWRQTMPTWLGGRP